MYEIIGLRHVEYTRKDGQPAEGYEVHYTWDVPAGDGQGKFADRVWMRPDAYAQYKDKLMVGAPLMPVFNSRGMFQGWVDSPME